MAHAPDSDEQHLAVVRKYAPFKALGSQLKSPGAQRAGQINTLLHRWKPCPGDIAR